MTDSARILVVDNYDSFVYTIVGYLKTLGATVTVVRNDAIDPSAAGRDRRLRRCADFSWSRRSDRNPAPART